MKKCYQTKRIEVSAVQYTGDNLQEVRDFLPSNLEVKPFKNSESFFLRRGGYTLTKVEKGEWLVDTKDNVEVMDDILFNDKYEVCKT
jgi:hypothetical protein